MPVRAEVTCSRELLGELDSRSHVLLFIWLSSAVLVGPSRVALWFWCCNISEAQLTTGLFYSVILAGYFLFCSSLLPLLLSVHLPIGASLAFLPSLSVV